MKKSYLLLSIACFAILFSCKKDDTNPSSTTSKYYIIGEFDGQSVNLQDEKNGMSIGVFYQSNNYYVETGSAMTKFGPGFNFNIKSQLSFGTMDQDEFDYQYIYKAILLGNNTFGNSDIGSTGFLFTYVDDKGVFWSTDLGTRDQTGSNFNITSKSPFKENSTYFNVAGTFTCKLYDEDGNVKNLKGGDFKIQMPYEY